MITVEQAVQEAERIKREEIQRQKEEEHRQEEERQRLAAEEADKIACTQLPVRLDALLDEGTAHSDGLTFVKSVSHRIRFNSYCPHHRNHHSHLQVSVPLMKLSGIPGGGANDVAQVFFGQRFFSIVSFCGC
jgi:hypothetical protein